MVEKWKILKSTNNMVKVTHNLTTQGRSTNVYCISFPIFLKADTRIWVVFLAGWLVFVQNGNYTIILNII